MATDPHAERRTLPTPVFAVVRGDLEVNEIKLLNALGGGLELRPMHEDEARPLGIEPGYASPIGIAEGVRVIADTSVEATPNLVAGANKAGFHLRNVNLGRDWQAEAVADIASAHAGHACARCGGTLEERRGIEMGHVFRLGQLYTDAFEVQVLTESGERALPIMGCYGIGVDRIVAAAVQANFDEQGIRWPAAIAPYAVHVVALGLDRDDAVRAEADALYEELTRAGLDVLLDDRIESPGVKFNDADLIGIPLRVTVSSRNLKDGVVEVQPRGGAASKVARGDAVAHLVTAHREALA